MDFDFKYLGMVGERFGKLEKGWINDYRVTVDPDFTLPSLLDIVRYLAEWGNNKGKFSAESKDAITRIGILNKPVTIWYKGEKLEGFTMNDPRGLFDVFPVLQKHPTALMVLQETACARMLEKSLPLPIERAPTAAATKQSQILSSEKPGAV